MKGTGGNSLFVLETLRSILETNPKPDLSGDTDIPLPESIQNLIQSRVRKLNLATKTFLENAAIIGSEFDLKMLVDLSQQADAGIVRIIEELEQHLILHAAPHSTGQIRYRFNHENFREALLSSISPAKTMMIHGNVAEFLANKYQPQQAAILAHHHQAAGTLTEASKYWIAAGNRARDLFSISDAYRLYSRAEALIQDIEETLSDDEIYRLYAPWCEMSYETHDTQQVRRLGNDLLSLGRKRTSPLLIGTALDTLSDACLTENKIEEGLDLVTRALPYLQKSGNTFEHMEAYIHRGVFLYTLNQLDEAIVAFEDALALGSDDITPEIFKARSNAHSQISGLRTLAGWPERGRHHARLSLEDSNITNRTYQQIAAYFALTISSYHLGEYHEAREYAYTGIDLAERTQALRVLGYLQGYASTADLIVGKVDSAFSLAQKTLRLGEKQELFDIIALGCNFLGDVYISMKAPERAIEYYERGAMAASGHFLGIKNLIRLGFVQSITGQSETGHQTLAFCLAAVQNANLGLDMIITEHLQSLVYLADENWDQAGRLAKKVKEEAKAHALPFQHLSATKSLAIIALNTGDADSAVEQLRDVAQQAKSLGNIWLELETLLVLENALTRMGGTHDPLPRLRLNEIKTHLVANTRNKSLQEITHKLIQTIDQGYS
jgi:predicted ATPase